MTSVISDLQEKMQALEKVKAEGEEYRFKATHDSLTGTLNRAAIFDVLKRELLRAQREGTFVGVLLADIDHFKKINDVYGHLTGDAVLREVAQRINAAIRTYDSVGRYGGEEFLVVLSGVEEEPVKHAERIRVLVSETPVATREGAVPVTLSLGAAISGPELQEIEELIRVADAALYRAKRGGRNRVEAASVSAAESSSV
jgi:diguanylate cyclase (GGDEF)-like protein